MDNTKKSDRRISIVLNGKERLYEELAKDKQAYEELLNQEISATTEERKGDQEFEWIIPDQKQPLPKVVDLGERRRDKQKLGSPYWDDGKSEESPKLPSSKRKKKKNFEFKSLPIGLIGIVMSAIIVGVSFGLMMLTIFTGEKVDTVTRITPQIQTPPAQEAIVPLIPGQIPVLGVEVVQGGAFSLVEKGEEAGKLLKDQGFASALTSLTEPLFLFIGLGLDREQAAIIGEYYKEIGQEVYLKPYAVSATGMAETDEQAAFFSKGVDLFQQLTLLSVNGLATEGTLFTSEMMTELTTSYEAFFAIDIPFPNNESQMIIGQQFQTSLSKAYETIQLFSQTKDKPHLWNAQQHLLDGLLAYELLVKHF